MNIHNNIRSIVLCGAMLLLSLGMNAQRERICIDDNWQFAFGNASSMEKDFGCGTEYFTYLSKASSIHNEGPYSSKFDASSWEKVDLPHDWVTKLPFDSLASHSHGYKTVGYKYPETSVGWYRKTFNIPKEDEGRHIWLQFDGIFRDARIWLNGFYLGSEPSGYATRVYDISEYLNYGGENLICVRADASTEEGWFYEGAGIYRHVWLNKASPLCVAPFGTFVHSDFPDGNFSRAVLSIETTVQNMGLTATGFSLKHRVEDALGRICAECEVAGHEILPKDKQTVEAEMKITAPELWSCEHPALYKVITDVLSDGVVVDSYTTVTGIRKVEFDPDRGFFLNGESVKLKGVNMHQDHNGVGSAITDELQEWRLMQLKKFGCNAYRASHNPMTPEVLDLCDRLGILVIEENRLMGVNGEHIRLLERMIKRDRNHPSIILWSAGNEEWAIEWNDWGIRIAASMREYCHRLDPTRLMTVASSGGPSPLIPADVAGYNYILQNPVEKHRSDYPKRCALGSEETSGCGTRGIYFDDVQNGRMASLNRSPNGPDSLYNCIERGWKFYNERPWLSGLFYWTGFDYRGEPNPLKFPATGSEFGILDWCGFPKDEAFYLASCWTDKPVLHILPHWNLPGHEGEKISIWVYSNCEEVELSVNGRRLGRKAMPQDGHLEWEAVYKPGNVTATGYTGGKIVAKSRVETTGKATKAQAIIEYKTTDGRWKEFTAEGILLTEGQAADYDKAPEICIPECPEDIASGSTAIVNVSLIDSRGLLVPDACETIRIKAAQGWELLGAGNGDPAFRGEDHPAETKGEDGSSTFSVRSFNGLCQIILSSRQLN
ncbi:MAG: glycoside hydrolase family 2 TIM barrel-domain containing protein [Bacteroidales bacterium]|nr:glycoside hydrolase family 2 TIM barrel-domain containing protein [Bacteroidales bacterium]